MGLDADFSPTYLGNGDFLTICCKWIELLQEFFQIDYARNFVRENHNGGANLCRLHRCQGAPVCQITNA